jgi:hypothetical protein
MTIWCRARVREERGGARARTRDGGWGLFCWANQNGVWGRNMGVHPNMGSGVGSLLK